MAMSVITRGYIFCMGRFQSPFLITRSTYSDGADGEGTASMAMGRRLRHGPHRQWPIWGGSINGCTPIAGWFFCGKTIHQWMIWGYPHFRKPSYVSISFDDVYQPYKRWWLGAGLLGLPWFTHVYHISGSFRTQKWRYCTPSLRPCFGIMFLYIGVS